MQEQKSKKQKSFAERLCAGLDIPAEVLPGGHRIEISGRSGLKISGCGKILLYAPCEIRVALSGAVLSIVGRDLVCVAYSAGEVAIEGRIDNVAFREAGA